MTALEADALNSVVERARNKELKDVLKHIRAFLKPPRTCDHCGDVALDLLREALERGEHRHG